MKNAKENEQRLLFSKYKKLRNKVNSQIRKESVDFNNNRNDQANDENEIWNVIKEVTKPKEEAVY